MEHALPRRIAGTPRTWSLCMTSENHGTVGPAGCTFSHAPEKHERVLVVEVPAAAGAPVDQVNLQMVGARQRRPVAEFKGYIDGQPAVTWLNRDNMPSVGTKLFTQAAANKAAEEGGLSEHDEDTAEGIELIDTLMDNISEGGNYGEEATLTFLSQIRQCFAADRASRQVANKAEVEPVAWMRITDITEWADTEPETDGWTPLYATPPATTGASTAPASIDTHRFHDLLEGWYHSANASKLIAHIDQHVAREVAAQAGQVAVPEDKVKLAERVITAGYSMAAAEVANELSIGKGGPGCAERVLRTEKLFASAVNELAAPSPAKESK